MAGINKNDLRYIKTENLIRKTYLALKKPGCEVRVTDLCKAAPINKTTFYDHYETVDALSRTICEEFMDELVFDCPKVDQIYRDTEGMIDSMNARIVSKQEEVDRLFEPNMMDFLEMLEPRIFEVYADQTKDAEMAVRIRFAIGGAVHVFESPDTFRKKMVVQLIRETLQVES